MISLEEGLKFTKMQGLGNDYIYVNCLEKELENPEIISRIVSDRHFGIGSDGLILICRSTNPAADFKMRIFNKDGSEAETCGNGLRCCGKYVFDKSIKKKQELIVDTLAGLVKLQLQVTKDQVSSVKVNMGEPKLTSVDFPVSNNKINYINQPFAIPGFKSRVTCVSMGNPHAIFFVDKLTKDLVHKFGPVIETHMLFPNKVNVEFVRVLNNRNIEMRVWERGAGETLACGTGASAVAVAAALNGLTDRNVNIELLGGNLNIEWSEKDNCVYQAGGAEFICEGIFNPRLISGVGKSIKPVNEETTLVAEPILIEDIKESQILI